MTKGILYYTDNLLKKEIADECCKYIEQSGLPITSVSLKPIDFGRNIVLPLERSKLTMFKQMLVGLESMTEDIIFFCEHDVLYHKSHFDFIPEKKDVYYYNQNNWRIRGDGLAVYFEHDSASQLCAYRELLIPEYRERVRRIELNGYSGGYEPGTRSIKRGGFSDNKSERWVSEYPNLDIRHNTNLTESRWSTDKFRDKRTCANWTESIIDKIPGWENFNKHIWN
jgi:hypothetical protein